MLGAEVERSVLLVLVEETELVALLGVDDGQDTGDGLADVVAARWHISTWIAGRVACREESLHSVQLGAGRSDLLDAQLAKLGLELTELLEQIILALVPQLDRLNLCRRLQKEHQSANPFVDNPSLQSLQDEQFSLLPCNNSLLTGTGFVVAAKFVHRASLRRHESRREF